MAILQKRVVEWACDAPNSSQIAFACQPIFAKLARASRREQFLQTLETVVPWSELEALIAPFGA
jgi:hypothetical protein